MASDEKRLNIAGLVPGEKYAIQVRAIDQGQPSDWSQKYHVETIDDSAGGTRTPTPPSLSTFVVDASGQYLATWNTVTTNTDGTPMVINRYELQLETQAYGTAVVPHYGQSGSLQTRSFNFGHLRSMFGGNIPTTITARLRVVNSAGTVSPWSEPLTAQLPVPNPPRNPASQGAVDSVKVLWEPPLDPIHLFGYRVYMSMTDENFVPDSLSRSNLVYEGAATEFTYTSLSYDLMHYFKIVSYSEPGLESTWVVTQAKPVSPYGPDDTPPTTPTNLAATLNADRSVSGQANVTWAFNDLLPENLDIAGFVVAWKLTTDTQWRNTYFEKTARGGAIDLPRAFGNYDIKISAFDFVGNYAPFSDPIVLEGAGNAPLALTGVDGIPRWDGMRLVWNHSESAAVTNGGKYEVQFKSTNSFADNVPNYTTGNNFLDIAGLTPAQSTWYFRVRAVDVINRGGPWSSVVTKTLPAFPSGSNKDGVAPQAAPLNPRTAPGINYINFSWDRVANNDATNYEVYAGTTAGFAIGAGSLVGVTPATSLMVNTIPGGPNNGLMAQNTTYYFKVRAVDLDGVGPTSAEASGQLTQIASGDLGINMSGENLLFNTSFEEDSNGDSVANYYGIYNNSAGSEPTTPSMPNTGRTGGKVQRISWTGVNTSTKGIYPINQSVAKANTEYTLSFYARANGGTGFGLRFNNQPVSSLVTALANPTPHLNNWNRYIYKFTTTATPDPANAFITVEGHTGNGGFVEFDDIQLEAGNIASAYKTGTVSFGKLATGTLDAATLTVATGGSMKSADYDLATKKGFLITGTGINLLGGTVNAATLQADSTISNKLYVGSLLQMALGGIIQSSNYRLPGTNGPTDIGAGYRITETSFDMRSGTVAAGALSAGTITSPAITLGAGGILTVDQTGSIQSSNWSTNGPTGWKIDSTGITMDGTSKIAVNALETGVLTSTAITIGSGGQLKSSGWDTNAVVRWQLGENGLTMIGGTITGATIVTNQLKSAVSETLADGSTRYRFSIDNEGYAEFVGARVYGNMSVGSGTGNAVQSGNWDGEGGVNGWKIYGSGASYFRGVTTRNLTVLGNGIVGAGGNTLQSAGFVDQSAGWRLTGDGDAQFNGGSVRVGSGSAGQVWMRVADGGSTAQIRFYKPGDTGSFSTISSLGDNTFEMRGAYGGLVSLRPAWFTGRTHVVIAQDAYVTGEIRTDNGITTEYGGINVKSGGGGLDGGFTIRSGGFYVNGGVTMTVLSGSAAEKYVVVSPGGVLGKGVNTSSINIKKNVEDLDVDYKKILELRPRQYHFKSESGNGPKSVGFIAEEAMDAGLEKWVAMNMDKTNLGFDYPFFVVALQQVARAHEAEIEALKAEVKKLSQRA